MPEWVAPARSLFNASSRKLSHCFQALPSEFRAAVFRDAQLAGECRRVVFCRANRLGGFAVAALNHDPSLEAPLRIARTGDVTILCLCADGLESGRALLDDLLEWARKRGAPRIVGFDAGEQHNNLPFFNCGFAGLPELYPTVPQLLTMNGFSLAHRELQMQADIEPVSVFDPLQSPLPAGILSVWARTAPCKLELCAADGVRTVGSCVAHKVEERQQDPRARQCAYVSWLGVDPEYQRRGIGRALLTSMIERLMRLGMRQVLLTTGSQNWRAQPLYLSMGFRVVGTSISLTREL
jgi:ribosomal protein S18 acetylase RimI-like enzyme